MGRALLIITLGSFIILGIIQQAVTSRQGVMTDGNIETFMVNHVRNATGSALEVAINRIAMTNDWSDGQLWYYPVDEMNDSVDVSVAVIPPSEDIPEEIFVRSTLQMGGRTIQSFAYLQEFDFGLPTAKAALAVYGSESTIVINGRPLKIDGRDHDYVTGELNPDGEDVPGIVSPREDPDDLIERGVGEYDGDPPYEQDLNLDGEELVALIELYKQQAQYYDSADNNSFGSTAEPRVITFYPPDHPDGDDKVVIAGDQMGAGIMIIPSGVEVRFGGNLEFVGLVIVEGEIQSRGTIDIYGGVLLVDEQSYMDIELDAPLFEMGGDPTIHYSSNALHMVREALKANRPVSHFVDRISY